jgi:hypothetical protein
MSVELKIKSKHLSEEAKIIRFEEQKILKRVDKRRQKHYAAGNNQEYKVWEDKDWSTYYSISTHRKRDVRNENRATFLARAYLKGVPYRTVEQKRLNESEFMILIFPRMVSMIVKYGKHLTPEQRQWDSKNSRYVATEEFKKTLLDWVK